MFKAIDKYVFKECAWATLAVIVVLLVILLGNTLVQVLGDISKGKLPVDTLGAMLLVNLVHYLVVLVPMGVYLGILFGMGRFYRDSEMSAMFACGIGIPRLYRPIVMLVLPLTILTLVLSMFLAPWTAGKREEIHHNAKYAYSLSGLVAGKFNVSNNGDRSLYFESWEQNGEQMRKVLYYGHDSEGTTVQTADKAHIQLEERATYVVFENGKNYTGTPGGLGYRIVDYAEHGIRLKSEAPPVLKLRTSSIPSPLLWGTTQPDLRAEWHWRLAVPIACLLLGLLALPLSYSSPRKGRYSKMGVGILIYIIYLNAIGLGRAWIEKEIALGALGLWWAHAIVVVATGLLVLKLERKVIFAPRVRNAT